MKNFFTLVIAFVFTAATLGHAASYTTSKGAAISIDPIDLINGRVNLTYEKKLGANNSLTINGSYWSWASWLSAFGVGASYRWYIDPFDEGKTTMNVLSVGPRADFFFWSYDLSYVDHTYTTFAIGAEVNYKWTFSDKWIVEPTLKLMIPVKKESGYDYYNNYGFGVNLGMAF